MADDQGKPQILNQTLGELLRNNSQAQGVIMKQMHISPEQFQQLLKMTGNNQMMNMTIGDLFKNGMFQKAAQMNQVSPEQMQQMMGMVKNGQPPAQSLPEDPSQQNLVGLEGMGQDMGSQPPKVTEGQIIKSGQDGDDEAQGKRKSFFEKLKGLFG